MISGFGVHAHKIPPPSPAALDMSLSVSPHVSRRLAFSVVQTLAVAASTTALATSSAFLGFPRGNRQLSSASSPLRMSAATDAAAAGVLPAAPVARREEGRSVLAGRLDPADPAYLGHNGQPLARQSEAAAQAGSASALLDPPVPVPDPYGWMRDEERTDPEVLAHLGAENAYTEALTAHLGGLRDKLYGEMLAGIVETDHTVPAPRGGYLYYSRTYEGRSYRGMCRAPLPEGGDADAWIERAREWDGTSGSPVLPGERVYLDINELAEGKPYCATGQVRASPSQDLLAYSVDFSGDEVCGLYVANMESGAVVDHDPDLECTGQVQWGADDSQVYYLTMDEQKRPYRMYRRTIGSDEPDELIFQEDDELYWMNLQKSFDGRYIFVSSQSKETAEVHYVDLSDPAAGLRCVAKRRRKVLYNVRHRAGSWFITSNVGGTPNMKLMVSPAVPDSEDLWEDVVDENGDAVFNGAYDRSISGLTSFRSHSVATGREGGLPQVWVLNHPGEESSEVAGFVQLGFNEDAYDVGLGSNLDCGANHVVLSYDSLVTPSSSIRVPLGAPTDLSKRTVLKEQVVPGYDKAQYACERTTVKSRDGSADIPVSLVYRADVMEKVKAGETVPTHLYGYGSYGACMEASFRGTRRTLLDRGMVYVIAHVRGGGEMGRQWYEEPNGAKYLCKKNTFTDFVDVARWLTEDRKITSPSQLSCEGRSAGGLLIGASINEAPELFKMALLGVPL